MNLQIAAGGNVQDLFQVLDDTRCNLLVFGQAAPPLPDMDGLLNVHALPITAGNEAEQARVQVPRSAYFLLRPDGHIGLCGRVVDAAAVRRYFAENLGLRDGATHRPIAGGDRPTAPVASVVRGGAC